MVGTCHEGREEGFAFFCESVADVFDGVVHEGGVVFAVAVVVLRGVPLCHPYAQVIPGGVRCRHVMRAVAVFGENRNKARYGYVRKVGGLLKTGMVGKADMR